MKLSLTSVIIGSLMALVVPAVVFALAPPTDFKEAITLLLNILQNLIGIMFSSIVVGMLYAVAIYMINSDNEKKREQIKPYLIYGVIGLTVCMGLWGFIGIINTTVFGGAIGIPLISPPAT